MGPIGIQGPQGPIGPTGETGPTGAKLVSQALSRVLDTGNEYQQVFDDGTIATFVAPRGPQGSVDPVILSGIFKQLESLTSRISSLEGTAIDINDVYPVGSIYISTSNTVPTSLFGGTWEQIQGRFLLAASSSYPAGSTGGSADAVVVSHNHTFEVITGDSLKVEYNYPTLNATGTTYNYPSVGTGSGGDGNGYIRLKESGVDGTGKNLPPYLSVYIWKRTA